MENSKAFPMMKPILYGYICSVHTEIGVHTEKEGLIQNLANTLLVTGSKLHLMLTHFENPFT